MTDRLHAYWRMPYIKAPVETEPDPHLFANLPKNTDDQAVYILHRAQHSYMVLNKYPYNAGHLLVVPYQEVATLSALSAAERADLMETIAIAEQLLEKALQPNGINVGFNLGRAAGAGIPQHLHCHLVPRWQGDNNFMPVIANTRVLPDSMDNMWQHLSQVMSTLA